MHRRADLATLLLTGVALVAACGEPAPAPATQPAPVAEASPPAARERRHIEPVAPPVPAAEAAQEPTDDSSADQPAEREARAPLRVWEILDHDLEIVARSQNDDGSWGASPDPATTGLMLLTFLGAGETHNSGQYKDVVKSGLLRLVSIQREDGGFAAGDVRPALESDLVAALALTEAFGLTGSRLFKQAAQRAVDHVSGAQNDDGGWGDDESNASATIWGAMVLKSARMSELRVAGDGLQDAAAWIASVSDLRAGHVKWRRSGGPDSARPLPSFSGDALLGGAILVRVFAGEDWAKSEELREGAARLLDRSRSWGDGFEASTADDWWIGTAAMRQSHTESDDVLWIPWGAALRAAITERARRDGDTSAPPDAAATDEALRLAAVEVLALRATQGYRRVFRSSDR